MALRCLLLSGEYRAERQKIGDRRVRLVTDFLAQESSMTEDEAGTLANEDFAIALRDIPIQKRMTIGDGHVSGSHAA
jgi:hypothetical protein